MSQIATFGTFGAKAVVRDVGRILDMPYNYCDGLSKLIPHDPTEPEIDATRERLCLDRLLAAEATAPVRRAEARAWYLAHPVERSMRAEGPAVPRARIVDRLRLRAKIQRAPQPPAFTPPRRGSRSAPHR